MKFVKELKFDANGLIPAVVQDHKDGAVLMVAYMNKAAVLKTLKTKKATFWSRPARNSGSRENSPAIFRRSRDFYYDCDGDCLLVKVEQVGGAACHTGYRSCFYRKVGPGGTVKVEGKRLFDPDKVYK
jgi:Phosphoribosyl-AMP cyclohydrolase